MAFCFTLATLLFAVIKAVPAKARSVPHYRHRMGQNAAQLFQCPLRGSCSAATQGWVNVLCGWLLHCKSFLAISAVIFVSTVVCPACLCGGVPLALMNSASEVPIGLSTSKGRCHSRSVLALG